MKKRDRKPTPKPTIATRAGDILHITRATCAVEGGTADLAGPPGRELVVLLLGVTDRGVPFDVEPMLAALGYVPGPALQAAMKEGSDG